MSLAPAWAEYYTTPPENGLFGSQTLQPQPKSALFPLKAQRVTHQATTFICAPTSPSFLSYVSVWPPCPTSSCGLTTPPTRGGTSAAASALPPLTGRSYVRSPYSFNTSKSTCLFATSQVRTTAWPMQLPAYLNFLTTAFLATSASIYLSQCSGNYFHYRPSAGIS